VVRPAVVRGALGGRALVLLGARGAGARVLLAPRGAGARLLVGAREGAGRAAGARLDEEDVRAELLERLLLAGRAERVLLERLLLERLLLLRVGARSATVLWTSVTSMSASRPRVVSSAFAFDRPRMATSVRSGVMFPP
jgi:hypothetical protein